MFENAGNHWQAPQAQTHETFLGLQTPELPVRTFPILDQHMCRGHHACMPFKLGDPGSILARTYTQGLQITEEKELY